MNHQDGLRIGDRERDEAVRVLHEAFAQGRLTRDELDQRLEAALSARTIGDLRPITADLPGGRVEAAPPYGMPWRAGSSVPPPGHPAAAPRPPWPPVRWAPGRWRPRGLPPVLLAVPALGLAGALVTHTPWPLFAALRLMFLGLLVMAVAGVVRNRHRRRSHGVFPGFPRFPGFPHGPGHRHWG